MQGNPQTGSCCLGMLLLECWDLESRILIRNHTKFHRQGIQNAVPGIRRHSADSRIQAIKDCLGLALGRNVHPTYNKAKCQLFFLSLFFSFYSFLFIYQLLLLTGGGLNTFWKSDFRIFSEKKNWSTRDGRGTIVALEQLTTCLKLRTNRSVQLIGINLNCMESSACSA